MALQPIFRADIDVLFVFITKHVRTYPFAYGTNVHGEDNTFFRIHHEDFKDILMQTE